MGQIPEPVRLTTLVRFLERMGLEGALVDEAQGFLRVRIKGENGRYDLYLVPRGQMLHFQIPSLLTVPKDGPRSDKLLALLLELNWVNVLGKYSWDPGDGEVRYGYALVAPAGVSFAQFSLALSQCLKTVDVDLPRLEKTLRTVSSKPSADPQAGSAGRP
jgi:hypothetical protein